MGRRFTDVEHTDLVLPSPRAIQTVYAIFILVLSFLHLFMSVMCLGA